jgi:hypothetical protein
MNQQHIYGVVNSQGIHTDVSTSERGAKNFATRNGFNKVSIRYKLGYAVEIIAIRKENGRWRATTNEEK